jgi:hypothetical protein
VSSFLVYENYNVPDGDEADRGNESNDGSNLAMPRKQNPGNVGGWISPNFAREIDRSWLEQDANHDSFELARYVPQVGDVVLYVWSMR